MADIRIINLPVEAAPADADSLPLDGTPGVRRVTMATLKTQIPAAIQAASPTVRGGVKTASSVTDPIVYTTVGADARFALKPVPVADLPSFTQYSGPSLNTVGAATPTWLRIIKWPVGVAMGGFEATISEVAGQGEYDVSVTLNAGLGTLVVRNGTRGANPAPAFGPLAFRLVRKAVAAEWEVFLEVRASASNIATNSLRVLLRALMDGSTAGTTRPVIEFAAAETIGGAITVTAEMTLYVNAVGGTSDFVVWGAAFSLTNGTTLNAVYLTADGRLHLIDTRTVGLKAGTGDVLDLFAANKIWARGNTDGRTVTPSTPALPRLVRVTPSALAAETFRDITHNLNLATADLPGMQVYNTAGGALVPHSAVANTSANVTRVSFAAAQTGTYLFVIIG